MGTGTGAEGVVLADVQAELAVVREDQVLGEVGVRGLCYQRGQRAVDEQE